MTDAWMSAANCLGVDPSTMFPGTGRGEADAAKAICKRCVCRDACLQYALTHRIEHGVWGGLTEEERKGKRPRRTGQPVGRPKLPHATRACYARGCRRPECIEAARLYRARRRA